MIKKYDAIITLIVLSIVAIGGFVLGCAVLDGHSSTIDYIGAILLFAGSFTAFIVTQAVVNDLHWYDPPSDHNVDTYTFEDA